MQIASFPQACVRSDRQAVYASLGQDTAAAMADEFALGLESLAHASEGVSRFAGGEGRSGSAV